MTQAQEPLQGGTIAEHLLKGQQEPRPDLGSDVEYPSPRPPSAWPAYWSSHGQPWRTDPEVDSTRRRQLEAYLAVAPNPRQGTYPFRGVRLSRADVEWLLATHENGKGPVDWQDETQLRRKGLDLRGAVLGGDLRGLPLSRLQGGLARGEWDGWALTSKELLEAGAIQMDNVDLFGTHLEQASLASAQLRHADLRLANLRGANLTGACLEGANLTGACLEGANLTGACLKAAYLTGADLGKANLHRVQLERAILFGTQLNDAYLVGADLEGANLTGAHLEGADLRRARLGRAILSGTLNGIDLSGAIMADENGTGPRLAAVAWGSVDLSVVDWSQVKQLDDEYVAYRREERADDALTESQAFKRAIRAYRQLAVSLRSQGHDEEASGFAYRAYVLHRETLRRQVAGKQGGSLGSRSLQLGRYLFASLLDLTTGYGYKPWRSMIAYSLIVAVFALAYSGFNHISFLPDAVALSVSGFHGRSPFPSQSGPSSFMVLLAIQSMIGLLVEICYIVVYTKRFLEK
jgi:uncharacterized protein YjbI with pentapeptide repeats